MNDKFKHFFKKKNLSNLIVIGVVGFVLLVLNNNFFSREPGNEQLNSTQNQTLVNHASNDNFGFTSYQQQLEARLQEAFSNVTGVGEVIVMVTLRHGNQLFVAEDKVLSESITSETDATGGTREVTNRTENISHVMHGGVPLVLLEAEPRVEGVIIVAQGGGDIRIVEALINATRAVLGIEAHRISVLEKQ